MWKTQEVEPSCRPCRLQSLAMQEPCYSEAPGHSYPGSSPLDRQRWAVALVAWVMHHESPSLLSNLLLRLFSLSRLKRKYLHSLSVILPLCGRFFRSGLFCLVHSSLHHNFGLAMNHGSLLYLHCTPWSSRSFRKWFLLLILWLIMIDKPFEEN